jgi:hypothetical protein
MCVRAQRKPDMKNQNTPPRVALAVFPRRIPTDKEWRGAGTRATSEKAKTQTVPIKEGRKHSKPMK